MKVNKLVTRICFNSLRSFDSNMAFEGSESGKDLRSFVTVTEVHKLIPITDGIFFLSRNARGSQHLSAHLQQFNPANHSKYLYN